MSFDLYVFDADVPDDPEDRAPLLEDESGWELTPSLEQFVSELEVRHPDLDDGSDSPWASWPLRQVIANGTGCAFNIVWSHADDMRVEVLELARVSGLTVYDPQADRVIRPTDVEPIADPGLTAPSDLGDPAIAKRRWWKRDP